MALVRYIPNQFEDKVIEWETGEPTLLSALRDFADNHGELIRPLAWKRKVVTVNDVPVPTDELTNYELNKDDVIEMTHTLEGGFFSSIFGWFASLGKVETPETDADVGSETYDWDGPKTSTKPDQPIHVLYGEHIIGGQLINFNMWSDGQDNYLDMLLALCEGEIGGIMKADESGLATPPSELEAMETEKPFILLNDKDGFDYEESAWALRVGTNTQTSVTGFRSITTVYDQNQVAVPGPDTWTTQYTTNANIDRYGVRVSCPALFKTNNKGKIRSRSVSWRTRHRVASPSGVPGDWNYNPSADTWYVIQDKTKSEVNQEQTITTASRDTYDIEVQRSNKATTAFDAADDMNLEHYIEYVDEDLAYPNTAVLAIRIKATDQISGSFPNVLSLVRGKKVRVPDLGGSREFQDYYWTGTGLNFAKLLDGTDEIAWDGVSYTTQWTNNPAYILRDLLLDTRYGMGHTVDSADLDDDTIDAAARKCWYASEFGSSYESESIESKWDVDPLWTDSDGQVYQNRQFRQIIKAPLLTGSGSEIRIQIQAHATNDTPITGCSIGLRLSVDDFDGPPTRVTFDGGADGTTIPAGTSIWSDWITFDLDVANEYLVHVASTGNPSFFYMHKWVGGAGEDPGPTYYKTSAGDDTLTESVSYVVDNSVESHIEAIQTRTTSETGAARFGEGWHKHELNYVIDSRQDPPGVLSQMAKVSRILIFWNGGYIKFKYEEDETPVQLFTMGNILEDSFTVSYTPQSKIPNIIEVQYADRDNDYKTVTREVVNEQDWADGAPKRINKINLIGVTQPDQALREAKLHLNKARYSKKSIQFNTTIGAAQCEPGDIIAFQHDVPQWGWGGRCGGDSSATNKVIIDQPVPAEVIADPTSYDIQVQFIDDTVEVKDILSVSGNEVTVSGNFSYTPEEDDPYIIGVTDSTIKEYRIKEMTLAANDTISINAMEHVAAIYGDSGASYTTPEFPTLPDPSLPAPQVLGLTLYELHNEVGFGVSFRQPGLGLIGNLITFSDITDGNATTTETEAVKRGGYVKFVSGDFSGMVYKVAYVETDTMIYLEDTSVNDSGNPGTAYQYDPAGTLIFKKADIFLSTDNEKFVKVAEGFGDDDIEYYNCLPGITYYVRVYSVNQIGVTNPTYVEGSIILTGEQIKYPSSPSGLEVENKGGDRTFDGQDCKVVWRMVAPYGGAGSLEPEQAAGQGPINWALVKDFVVQVWSNDLKTKLREEITTDQFYTYTYEKNWEDNNIPTSGSGAIRNFWIKVYQRNYYNYLSLNPAQIQVSNPRPNMTNIIPTVQPVFQGARVSFTNFIIDDNDMDYYKIYYGFSNPPTASVDHISRSTQNYVVQGQLQNTKLYVQIEPYDRFGVGSPSQIASCTTLGFDFIDESDNQYTLAADSIVASIIKNNVIDQSKFNVASLSAITTFCGSLTAGWISGVVITGGLFRTATPGHKRIEITSDGIALKVPGTTGGYGDIRYGDSVGLNACVLYGAGAVAFIHHIDEAVPFYIQQEQDVGDFHFYNRTTTPSGPAEIGDVCVANGILYICTTQGTPGTWTKVGTQT